MRILNGLSGRGREFHVGHAWENGDAFKVILKDFMAEKSLNLDSIGVEEREIPGIDYKRIYVFDTKLADSWRDYHKSRAGGMRMERAEDSMKSTPLGHRYELSSRLVSANCKEGIGMRFPRRTWLYLSSLEANSFLHAGQAMYGELRPASAPRRNGDLLHRVWRGWRDLEVG